MTFANGLKKEEDSTIKFSFLSIDDYERSLSFLLDTSNGIKSVDGSMKLHAASLYSVQIMATIAPDINDHVAPSYDRKVYIGKVLEIDDSGAEISFSEYIETLSIASIFGEPKKRDEIWVDFVKILYVIPVAGENVMETFSASDAFLFFTVLDYFHFF